MIETNMHTAATIANPVREQPATKSLASGLIVRSSAQHRRSVHDLARVCLIVGVATLAAATGIAALGSGLGMSALPRALAILDQRLPGIFRVHMVASGLALILIPCTVLLRRYRSAHRYVGRVTVALVLTGAIASLPSSLASEASPLARLGFFTQGVLCLAFLLQAIRAIRMGKVERHARLMLCIGAIMFGAVLLRLMMALAVRLQLPFEAAYAIIAWLSWALPLTGVCVWYHSGLARLRKSIPAPARMPIMRINKHGL